MPPGDSQSDQVQTARASLNLAFTVLAQVGGLTLGVLVVVLVAGIVLDRVLGTRPLFTLLLFVVSFPISMFIIYRVALSAVAKLQPAPKAGEGGETRDDNSAA